MNKIETLQSIVTVITNNQSDDGWTDLALIGKPLNDLGINYKAIGFLKLKELLEQFPDDIEIKKDTSHQVPVLFARVSSSNSQTRKIADRLDFDTKKAVPTNLMQWAWMGDFRQVVNDLKNKALKERWYYKKQDPNYPLPILSKYLKYTFFRLSKEGKISINNRYASFNTGLVDDLYESIYALFEKNKVPHKQEWYFHEFCTSGVGKAGKILVSNFNPLPERSRFYNSVTELIYDMSASKPQLNWSHIILDNLSRLPLEFLEDNRPKGFNFRDTSNMDTLQKSQYFESLSAAIEGDSKKFRAIKNRFADSLNLALKRVQWNFKTAIPMYYPKNNKMSLLLPLSLIDDERIDLALVVDKTESGTYLGHTVLPLAWAYSNARLITRPDSDWLVAEEIEAENIESAENEEEN
ncbi:DUF3825 domain-containing protein [Desulfobacter latus]|uniref:DUF3825 domain-containing protein n=1 Tax=Desulfobacter latus TaxID=2292 RepID=A0A850T3H0_9BACT|nr:DUF3825 domain-containing protein [Desulfobacter latus]NWH06910.1 DUF3825 domain-containing protein [Desulfobacter latus]